ncbi:MAG: type II toxin-antitoxin system VapC family toxin [Solirubrobacteraceae bacterium]|nr:type II toxin-antitoxin system VapC family toxin [Solirubrobacteraceae bacterium]
MSKLVRDCSVTMAWAFDDEDDAYSDGILTLLGQGQGQGQALAPSIWPLEVANTLLVSERRGRLTEAKTLWFIGLLKGLRVTVDALGPDRAFGALLGLAREHKLSSYDAAYLDLAMREGLPLATRDQKLRLAARHCGVPLAGK